MTKAPMLHSDRSLTWEELRALAIQYYGYYTFASLDLNNSGQRGDFHCACLNDRFPMKLSECNEQQLEIIATLPPELRERAYGQPPKKEA